MPDLQQPLEILESQIRAVADAARKITGSRVRRRTIAMLIGEAAHPKLPVKTVITVLDAIERIEAEHLK